MVDERLVSISFFFLTLRILADHGCLNPNERDQFALVHIEVCTSTYADIAISSMGSLAANSLCRIDGALSPWGRHAGVVSSSVRRSLFGSYGLERSIAPRTVYTSSRYSRRCQPKPINGSRLVSCVIFAFLSFASFTCHLRET